MLFRSQNPISTLRRARELGLAKSFPSEDNETVIEFGLRLFYSYWALKEAYLKMTINPSECAENIASTAISSLFPTTLDRRPLPSDDDNPTAEDANPDPDADVDNAGNDDKGGNDGNDAMSRGSLISRSRSRSRSRISRSRASRA